MDEKHERRRSQFGYLFWSSLVLLTAVVGFVAGWQFSLGWLRSEGDELRAKNSTLDAQLKRHQQSLQWIQVNIEKEKARLESLKSSE